ncbi:translocation/assembly module TamB domain-containing protein [Rasiella sp. SM2506]|uniref:translocation/assembly module TamB domain-containing protein n=1 Tax=Rasiella sp. SM2506 TaxID=3423914 RepID=UPI003D7BB528
MSTEKPVIKKTPPKTKKRFRWLRIIARCVLGILIFLLLLVAFIRSEWGQSIIVERAVTYVSDKTNTKVTLERAFVGFDGDIILEGLFLEDKNGDTLVYSKSLEADIPLWPIIKGSGIGVDAIHWKGLRANIHREDTITGYNFQFLIDAFVTETSEPQALDTSQTPLEISIGEVTLDDIAIDFNDAVLGIESKFVVGHLEADMETTDLEKMIFRADELLVENATISYFQLPIPLDPNGAPVPLPILSANKLTIKNTKASYKAYTERIAAELDIQEFSVALPNIDLTTSTFELDEMYLSNSSILINTEFEDNALTDKVTEVIEDVKEDIIRFEWPDIRFTIPAFEIENSNITYRVANAKVKKGTFNPNILQLNDLTIKASNIGLGDKALTAIIENTTFKEGSGFQLKNLGFDAKITDSNTSITSVHVILNQNRITNGSLKAKYPSIKALIEQPENSSLDANIPSFQLDIAEIFQFQPSLRENEYLATLSKKLLTGNLKAHGVLSAITIPNATVQWGKTTKISANALIKNATDPDNLAFEVPRFKANTIKGDVLKFVSEEEIGVNLPEVIELKGNLFGNLNAVKTDAMVTTSQGIATLKGNFDFTNNIIFDANLKIDHYNIGALMQNAEIGKLSLTVDTRGSGSSINTLDATLEAVVTDFSFRDYAIKDLKLEGNFKNGEGELKSKYKDENLNIDLSSEILLDSVATKASIYLDVIGADLQALGVMKRNVRTGLKIAADFKGNLDDFDVVSTIGDGVFVYDDKTYLLGDVLATAHIRKDTTSIWVDNKLLNLTLESNSNPQQFSKALQEHIFSYFYRDVTVSDTLAAPVNLYVKSTIRQAPILNEVFLVNLKDLDTVSIDVAFQQKKRKLKASITAPHINYSGMELDSLVFTMDTDADAIDFNLGFKNIVAGPLNIQRTIFKGKQTNNELNLDFIAFEDKEKMIQISSKTTGNSDRLRFHILPDSLLIQKQKWQTPDTNEIIITDKKFDFNDFNFSNGEQSVAFVDDLPRSKDHVAVNFKNFELAEILNYLNPKEQFAEGTLTGQVIVEEPFGNTGIVADFDISRLKMLDVALGTLAVDANAVGGNTYDFKALLSGGEIDLAITGDYLANDEAGQINLDLNINTFNMSALEGFSLGTIKETKGSFSGTFNINGSITDAKYDGSLNFKQAGFKIAALNAGFLLPSETLRITNEGLRMSNFTVQDENGNTLIVDGSVGTESLVNPTFDLNIVANQFQVINATKEDNDLVYGQAQFNAKASIKGDLQIPIVTIDASIDENTNITYVMPSATVNLEERDGIVIFVNRENPDAILTRQEEQTATFAGFDIKAFIRVGDAAKVTIVIDENTGDNFNVYGKGDFVFTMNPNGRMTLTGAYDVSGGHYEMSLYNLVKRKFLLDPSSRVSWAGDPFDANLDVRAVYEVEASASPLMAGGGTSSLSPQEQQRFRQVLPFYVYLNVDGELTKPVINFELDMPEDEQGAIGGQVYGRVQQINQQDGELNRQVFSLLVLSRFYPEGNNDGSRGGVASIARDNLNDALSDQLNLFSDKLLGNTGVELDFGLDSYTDYQGETPQERTQLEIAARKKLFNDRLIVSVGSDVDIQGSSTTDEATPLIGNVSLEYILTENGRYRLKGFRRNQFENVIDGQTIVSGLALIFTQEFNKFDELWDALLRSTKKAEREEKRKKEEDKKKLEEQNSNEGLKEKEPAPNKKQF